MHDSIMYEVARQRIADQRRAAVKDGEARTLRGLGRGALARGRRARRAADEAIAMPAIPDYAHELLAAAARESVPAQRPGAGLPEAGLPEAGLPAAGLPEAGLPAAGRGRHARAGR